MADLIGVLAIAWMTFSVACIFAIAFGKPPSARPRRRRRPNDPT